ncbi:MAG: hypothetical protein IH953_12470, partial [Chloroflexi bacterium]|nr:hypothetical protein [Chloroflexota bacterium]
FEFGWKRCLSPELKSEVREFLFDLEGASNYALGVGTAEAVGVRADGDHTLVVSLERPTGYFLQSLAASPFFPVPEHAVAVHGDNWIRPENIVSNGPFLLTAMDLESGITMKRNPDYHGVSRGNVSQIEVLFAHGDSGEPYKRYEQDQLDLLLLFEVSAEEVDIVRQRHPDEYLTAPVLGTSYVNFDVSRPPFDDARVRRAFCMAIDREWLSDITFRGYVTPAAGGFVPPGMPGPMCQVWRCRTTRPKRASYWRKPAMPMESDFQTSSAFPWPGHTQLRRRPSSNPGGLKTLAWK